MINGSDATTPLLEACQIYDLNKAQQLIAQGVDVDETDYDGRNALLTAICSIYSIIKQQQDAISKRLAFIKMILAAGANPNGRSYVSNRHAIVVACDYRDAISVVRLLIDYGAEWTKDDVCYSPPIRDVVSHREARKAIICKVLLPPALRAGGLRMAVRRQVAKHLWSMRFE